MKKNKKRIIVMGGSFNPPTLAHYRLMKAAVDALEADIGFFVPVSDAYLRRKMRDSHPPVVLSPELRVSMLKAMCTDSRMMVCEKEIGTVEPHTMPTMMDIQKDYPDAELYFLMGDDKLGLLSNLTRKGGFLNLFGVVLFSREDATLRQSLQEHEVLSAFQDRIVILPQPDGTEGVSSSLVRKLMLGGQSARHLLCDGVWQLFSKLSPSDFPDTINRFKGEYAYMSNRFPCSFEWRGLRYGNAEAAFQSSKCSSEAEREVYARCTADKASMRGGEQTPYPGWEEEKAAIMESVVRAKFGQNPALADKLAETGSAVLINGNNKHETFWGVDLYTWEGENRLGKILMEIRDK